MTVEWRKWCRLCAKSDSVDYPIFDSNDAGFILADKIKKYLSITVDESHQLPLSVCHECFERLSSFHQYAENSLQVQTMFNTLCTEELAERRTIIRNRYLSENNEEMKDNEQLEYKSEIEFEDSSYELFENKNYEMVPVEPEFTIKTRNGRRKNMTGNTRGKARGRGRPRKCEKTVPRIKIRAIPKAVKREEKHNNDLSNREGKRLKHPRNNQEEPVQKRYRRQKLSCSSDTPVVKGECSANNDETSIRNEDVVENNEENEKEASDKECNIKDETTEPPLKEDKDKQSKKLKKSELKALVPALYHFQCHVCDYVCKNWNALCKHCKELHQTSAQVTCVCGKDLVTRTSIIEHRSKHTDSTIYRCDKCEKTFHRKSLLNLHVMSHVPKEEQPYVCCKCARRFHCEALLRNHERVHLPKEERLVFPCHLCHKKFSSKSAVSAHLKAIHLGERPFVCDQCGHSFTSKGILQEHLTIHSDEAPWSCTNCNKNFKTKYRLKIHMDTHRETPYQCPKCPVQLSTRRTLRMHLVVHRDTKAYQCATCDKAFRRAKDLKNHNNLHTGRRPYTCPFCSRTFANGSNCRSHKRRMHPEELKLYEASLSLKEEDGQRPQISPPLLASEEESNTLLTDKKEDVRNIMNLSTGQISSLDPSDERKNNFQLNLNNTTPPPQSHPPLLPFSAKNLSVMDMGRRDMYNPCHIVHHNLLSRGGYNQQLMGFTVDQHYYSPDHEQEHAPPGVPAFPGNPYLHHQTLLYNRLTGNTT